jgi:hypothetical protein
MELRVRNAVTGDAEPLIGILNPIGTAERHARIRGQYIDEVLIERFL